MAKKTDTARPAGFTDTRRVKELMDLMAQNGLTEIELEEGQNRIVLRRGFSSAAPAAPVPVAYAPPPTASPPSAPAASAPKDDPSLIAIKSPMVGTFYSAPSPDSDPYVSLGSTVDDKTVVCTIEAMKVFNPINAETRGTIAKVLVSNGQVVEFGQTLFLVKPN